MDIGSDPNVRGLGPGTEGRTFTLAPSACFASASPSIVNTAITLHSLVEKERAGPARPAGSWLADRSRGVAASCRSSRSTLENRALRPTITLQPRCPRDPATPEGGSPALTHHLLPSPLHSTFRGPYHGAQHLPRNCGVPVKKPLGHFVTASTHCQTAPRDWTSVWPGER